MDILEGVQDYHDLKEMTLEELNQLADGLRKKIMDVAFQNGGHLASPLGAVELIISLLRSFDPDEDKIIFDVGHQAYAYKILTGRKDSFSTLRQWGGISGYPKRAESPYDFFDVGHSSTSLSAALGYAKARDLLKENHHVVAMIGDGALINGMAFEALNYVKESNTKVIFILNDNKMSINRRVGGFAAHLVKLSTNPAYKKLKVLIKDSCKALPKGESLEQFLSRTKGQIKSLIQPENIFESMGINYWGPFDGHNIQDLEFILNLAKRATKPVLIHVLTEKGKGCPEAEKSPSAYHGVSPRKSGENTKSSPSWSNFAASVIEQLAIRDDRIVCLTAAMKEGSKLNNFSERFPDRFFDVGIEEEHMLTFAAGMAAGGLRPIVCIYSTFLQRAMDQLMHDIAMQNLPVVLAVDRAGLVGEDGETHQGLVDVNWGRVIPNLTIMAPRDAFDLDKMFRWAVDRNAPTLIRYPRGMAVARCARDDASPQIGQMLKTERVLEGREWALLGYGKTVDLMMKARNMAAERLLPPPAVFDLRVLKPMDWDSVDNILKNYRIVIIAEDTYKEGSIGEMIEARAKKIGASADVFILGIPDKYIPQGTTSQQWDFCSLTVEKVVNFYSHGKKGQDPARPAAR